MVTLQEIELLASLLQRAGVNQIEALFANDVMDRLRALVAAEELKRKDRDEPEKP